MFHYGEEHVPWLRGGLVWGKYRSIHGDGGDDTLHGARDQHEKKTGTVANDWPARVATIHPAQ